MEAEERPMKKQRLSQDDLPEAQNGSQTDTHSDGGVATGNATNGALSSSIQDHQDRDQHPVHDEATENGVPAPNYTAPLADTIIANSDSQPMSKNQQKKLRRKLEWESKRDERKVIRKDKEKAKRKRKQEERKQAAENGQTSLIPPPKLNRPKAVYVPMTIVIDCDFDNLMRDGERKSLALQITRSYSDNRNSLFRAHLTICSFGGKLRERFDNVLSHYKGWKGVRFLDCDFVEAAENAKAGMLDNDKGGELAAQFSNLADLDKEGLAKLKEQGEVVYLTSEAEETLTELKPYSTYIIGGLVDRNREKGICYKRATKRGVRTAKLPISEFMDMTSRKVLATNHVNEIMLKWLECGDWGEAFTKAIPKRKGGKLKDSDGKEDQGDEEDEDEDEHTAGSSAEKLE